MLSILPKLPPGVFISMTIASAFWLRAVATTREMKASEPRSTGRLKSATTTAFTVVVNWEGAWAKTSKLLAANKKSPAKSKPNSIKTRKSFRDNVDISSVVGYLAGCL